jgi:hypothetical protein
LELLESSRYTIIVFKAEAMGVVIEICTKYPGVELESGGLT